MADKGGLVRCGIWMLPADNAVHKGHIVTIGASQTRWQVLSVRDDQHGVRSLQLVPCDALEYRESKDGRHG